MTSPRQLYAGGAIVSFSSRMFLTEVCHHPPLAILLLGQYSARGQVRRIHVQDESTLVNGQHEDRRGHQSLVQSLEGLLAGSSPDELMTLAGQIGQGSRAEKFGTNFRYQAHRPMKEQTSFRLCGTGQLVTTSIS